MTLDALLLDYGGVLTDYGDESSRGQPPLVDVVRRAGRAGVRTALVSNSGTTTPLAWTELFDRVVVSGEAGIAKPDPGIYRLAARLLETEPARCVVVDDLRRNIDGAVEAGMVGVHHRDVPSTLDELCALFACGQEPFMIR